MLLSIMIVLMASDEDSPGSTESAGHLISTLSVHFKECCLIPPLYLFHAQIKFYSHFCCSGTKIEV